MESQPPWGRRWDLQVGKQKRGRNGNWAAKGLPLTLAILTHSRLPRRTENGYPYMTKRSVVQHTFFNNRFFFLAAEMLDLESPLVNAIYTEPKPY